jgi:hypothetical protein
MKNGKSLKMRRFRKNNGLVKKIKIANSRLTTSKTCDIMMLSCWRVESTERRVYKDPGDSGLESIKRRE